MDRSSSPIFSRSSLPPSSAPPVSQSSQPRRTRPANGTADALAVDDVGSDPTQEEAAGPSRRRTTKAKGNLDANTPVVVDDLGEKVRDSFETFLKRSVGGGVVTSSLLLTMMIIALLWM
jgi:DNA replication licensing factor MCM6